MPSLGDKLGDERLNQEGFWVNWGRLGRGGEIEGVSIINTLPQILPIYYPPMFNHKGANGGCGKIVESGGGGG